MDLLKFIPPNKHDYCRNLRTHRHDGISNVMKGTLLFMLMMVQPH